MPPIVAEGADIEIIVQPVTEGRLGDLEEFFEARGAPHYCWCSLYREGGETKAAKKQALLDMVRRDVPVGVLAYVDGAPIGWCSVAPRKTYAKLERSRSMPRATPESSPTWTIVCFFVLRAHRKHGVARALLAGAVAYAERSGAAIVEGYTFDTADTTATHRGHSSLFREAGFQQDGSRWWLDVQSV